MSYSSQTRRAFVQRAATAGAAAILASGSGSFSKLMAQQSSTQWSKQIGLALYTVRDLMVDNYDGILTEIAKMGYTEIEPANGYNNMDPKRFRARLDELGLSMPSTHSGPTTGADMEKQLEGLQIMGVKYTWPPTPPRPPVALGQPGSGMGAYFGGRDSFTQAEAFGPIQPPETLESIKHKAAQLNAYGKIAQKYGIKIMIHNHTGEFEKLTDSSKTSYDVYLEETDPTLVVMQLDLGWAAIAGQDIVGMFKKNPGRYELWHLKDMFGLKQLNKSLSPKARVSGLTFEPVGVGQLDFKPFFEHAKLAGLKHFCVEQDNAATWGDSLAAARVSYKNLYKMLS